MARAIKWVITLAAGAGAFALGWWVFDGLLAMETGSALGIAAIPSSLVLAPLCWWAGRDTPSPTPSSPSPSSQQNTMRGDAGNVVQAREVRDIGSIGDHHVGRIEHVQQHVDQMVVHLPSTAPSAVAPVPGQVVVGPVPREPQHFQPPTTVIEALAGLAGGSVAVVCAMTGLRGAGKTQAAGAYARQRIADGWMVAWISAQSQDLVLAGIGELADALGLHRAEDNAQAISARVRNHLQTLHDPALLVFDNVTDPAHVGPFLPAAGSLQIVMTSTRHAIDRMGTRVPVELFSPDTAVRFLTDSTSLRDETGAHEVARELGYLPLALAQAAARITRIDRDYTTYLNRHQSVSVDKLLTARPGDPYPRGAAEAILLAIAPFTATKPSGEDTAAELALLDLLSVLSPDGISRALLAVTPPDVDNHDVDNTDGPASDEVLAVLFEASLIEFAGADDAVIVMHRLTQRVLRDRANHDLAATINRAARLLDNATFPERQTRQQRDLGDELIRHINTLWAHASTTTLSTAAVDQLMELRQWAVRQAINSAAYDRAIPLATEVNADQRRYRIDHPETLGSANNLAHAYEAGWDQAIPRYEKTLSEARRVLGDNHPSTLISANSLAYVYRATGRLEEAIRLYEKTLTDTRRVLGDNHPGTLVSADNLAQAYESAGQLDGAILLYEKTLTDRRRVLGDNNSQTLNSANNLAYAYRAAGRLEEAIPLYEKTLTDIRRVLGDNHPDTLNSANNLAYAYRAAGRLEEATKIAADAKGRRGWR